MKKVCVFCETWNTGGIEAFLCQLLTHMNKEELCVDLVTACLEQSSVFAPELKRCGVRMIQLSGSKIRWFANCRAFAKLLRQERYDVVHLNAFQGLQFVYLWLAKRAGVPMRIAHSHGSDLRKSPVRWCKLALHHMGKVIFGHTATARWACSRRAAEFLFCKGRETVIVPNGISVDRFRFCAEKREAVRAQLGLTDRFVVGSVGRLQHDKNQAFLLDMLTELLPRRPESTLLLVGEGPARQELERKAAALGIEDRVIFYGASSCVHELLWAMDVFAFPSLSEGLGIAAVEAQASGLPVVASEHIPEEAALTPLFRRVPVSDTGAWVKALMEPADTNRAAAADAVRQSGFEITDVAAQVRSTYINK